MERTEHKLSLDVHKTVSTTSIFLKKGDTAHRLLITLSEGGYPYHIGADCTAVFSALKPDGKPIFNDCRIEGDTVIYDMTEQSTAAEGIVNCEIQIYGGDGDLLTSASFLLLVEEGVKNRSAVVSSDEFTQLTAAINNASRAATTANGAARKADRAAAACMVIGNAQGESIQLDDAIDASFVGMRIFGKTTQSGTPTPANPATLVSMGALGSIDLTSNEQTITIPVSGGLPGIPVADGGNYTDANGQQWICDEIDFERGVYVKRIAKVIYDGSEDEAWAYSGTEDNRSYSVWSNDTATGVLLSLCDKFKNVVSAWHSSYATKVGIYADHATITAKYFRPPDESVKTIEQWRAWLAENPTTILYVLAEPIETDLPDEVLDAYSDYIQAYSGNTVVTNDSGAHMALEYIMDARKYIDKMISTGIHEATLE